MKNVENIMNEIQAGATQMKETAYEKMIEVFYFDKIVARIRLFDNNVFNICRISTVKFSNRFKIMPARIQQAIEHATNSEGLSKIATNVTMNNTNDNKMLAVLQRIFGELNLLPIEYPSISVKIAKYQDTEEEIPVDGELRTAECYKELTEPLPEKQTLLEPGMYLLCPDGTKIEMRNKKQCELIENYIAECENNNKDADYDYVRKLWMRGVNTVEDLHITEEDVEKLIDKVSQAIREYFIQ